VSALGHTLGQFAGRVNECAALRGTLAGWQPDFHIEARDTGAAFRVRIEGGRVQGVEPAASEAGDDALLLRADAAVLEEVFTGTRSPLGAYTDGLLEVYGPPKDQIKLDVIALVLWGA